MCPTAYAVKRLPSTLSFHSWIALELLVLNPNAQRFFHYRQNGKSPLLRISHFMAMSGGCEVPLNHPQRLLLQIRCFYQDNSGPFLRSS